MGLERNQQVSSKVSDTYEATSTWFDLEERKKKMFWIQLNVYTCKLKKKK